MKRLVDQTLYEILEVPPDASAAAIAAAVDRAQALYGPGSLATYTLMSSDEADQLVRRIEDARTTLLDPAARHRYDEELARGRAEARAAANGVTAAQRGEVPPVIPARPPPPADGEGEVGQGPAEAASPSPERAVAPPPVPPPHPIQLNREVAAPPAAPSPPPPAAAAPLALPPPPPAAAAPPPPLAAATPTLTPPPTATPVPMNPPPAPPPEPISPDATAWTGEVLRRLREARGITLQQLADRTKVTRHHIENVEADRYAMLPAPVYLRGILLSLARELRLDGQKVARSYLERFTAGTAPPSGAPKPR